MTMDVTWQSDDEAMDDDDEDDEDDDENIAAYWAFELAKLFGGEVVQLSPNGSERVILDVHIAQRSVALVRVSLSSDELRCSPDKLFVRGFGDSTDAGIDVLISNFQSVTASARHVDFIEFRRGKDTLKIVVR